MTFTKMQSQTRIYISMCGHDIKNTVVINDHAYTDTEFAHHYALKKESVLLDDDRKILYALMKKHFVL